MKTCLRLLALVCLSSFPTVAARAQIAAENPVTATEACAMLRGGSSSEDVLHAVQSRKLLESVNPAAEAQLKAAGAAPKLVDAMKSGTYTLSPFDAASARKRMAAGPAAGAAGGAAVGNPAHMANLLKGKLVTLQSGGIKNYDDAKLAGKKYFGIYYSAHWCQPCKMFTPKLVDFYRQMSQTHPEFEIVFISSDETPADMQHYMQEAGMPWAALRFERKAGERELTKYAGNGIPDLVVVDGDGKVLSDSYHGAQYVGPYKVMEDLGKLLSGAKLAATTP